MDLQIMKGLGFGLTSGIITTIGLIIGLDASTGSKKIVLGGILLIAIADALSDSMGMHISQESLNKHSHYEIWRSSISTFFSKFLFALTFALPFLFFSLQTSVIICIIWGLSLIIGFSYYIAIKENENPGKVVTQHVFLTVMVIIITFVIGKLVSTFD
ncbi:MAG: hypothetical protein QXG00_06480 [Candidatus Woesearchaeota archaeon]